ncbi:MAG: alkylhydroperoxidase family enzyme [Limisphaerales bacterium]|jgi:alkylhydroperoxidase family enzyme
MAHVKPMQREDIPALEGVMASSEAMMGFVPNSMLTMAHMPQMAMAFSMFAGTVFGADLQQIVANYQDQIPEDPAAGEALSPDIVQLTAYCVSLSAGCRYCQAHTSHNAHKFGIDKEKLLDVLNYETSALFSHAEKAVIGIALAAGQVPNDTNDEQFEALRAHFTQRQVVQLVGVISLFGFLNRWNDTMATQLEAIPTSFAQDTLDQAGWEVAKHAEET